MCLVMCNSGPLDGGPLPAGWAEISGVALSSGSLDGAPIRGLVESLPAELHGKFLGVEFWQYMALGLIVLCALLARRVLQYLVLQRLKTLAERWGQKWPARVVNVIASPGATLFMAVLVQVSYPALGLPNGARAAVAGLVRILVVVSLTWAAYALVGILAERVAARAALTESKLDDQLVPLLRRSLEVITLVAGALLVLQNMNIDVGSLLAGLGLGGLAFALAAKDTLANFFGSITIFADRPFQIGDWVVTGDAEGVVEEVGFRSTRIRTFYDSLITLPNSAFAERKIDNFGARRYRRTSFTLQLTYETTPPQLQAFVEGVRNIIAANPHTRKDNSHVYFSGFGAYSLDVMVYFFFELPSWAQELRERHHVLLEILRLAASLELRFAFPTQTLHVDSLSQLGQAYRAPAPLQQAELARLVRAYGPGGELSLPATPELAPSSAVMGADRAQLPQGKGGGVS